jgi:hypothetical protein
MADFRLVECMLFRWIFGVNVFFATTAAKIMFAVPVIDARKTRGEYNSLFASLGIFA